MLKAFLFPTYSRDQSSEDVKWLLLLVSAITIQMGLLKIILSLPTGFQILAGGLILTAVTAIPFFWTRLVLLTLLTAAAGWDYAVRHNPFSILFILAGITHIYYMTRCWNRKEK
jgi:hypothetical protein